MIKSGWVMVAAAVAGINLLMVTANTAIASSGMFGSNADDIKKVDDRSRVRVSASGTMFNFVAWNVCDEDRVTCVNVWGSGWFNTNDVQITAQGSFMMTQNRVLTSVGNWYALDLIEGSDKTVTFKASTSAGVIYIMLDEGDRKHPSNACVYGQLVGTVSEDSAFCKNDVSVTIG